MHETLGGSSGEISNQNSISPSPKLSSFPSVSQSRMGLISSESNALLCSAETGSEFSDTPDSDLLDEESDHASIGHSSSRRKQQCDTGQENLPTDSNIDLIGSNEENSIWVTFNDFVVTFASEEEVIALWDMITL